MLVASLFYGIPSVSKLLKIIFISLNTIKN